jgi:SAM-dependent methyltransferase
MHRELLIGCGSSTKKVLKTNGNSTWYSLTTLDINPDHNPDVVWDLCRFPFPFDDNTFDEIHAYEVLEHTGAQGDYKFFFQQFSEFWRILKPEGLIAASVPKWDSMWAWSDPSHTRVITDGTLVFLDQSEYLTQVGKTAMSDFRHCYTSDFSTEDCKYTEHSFYFLLKAIKPSRFKSTSHKYD